MFIIKPRYNEKERNEKLKIGKNIFISTLIVGLATIFMQTVTVYDI